MASFGKGQDTSLHDSVQFPDPPRICLVLFSQTSVLLLDTETLLLIPTYNCWKGFDHGIPWERLPSPQTSGRYCIESSSSSLSLKATKIDLDWSSPILWLWSERLGLDSSQILTLWKLLRMVHMVLCMRLPTLYPVPNTEFKFLFWIPQL